MSDTESVFTRIIRGELPGRFVWRDDRSVAMLTIAPIRPGHVLVIPIEEVDRWTDLDPATWGHLNEVSQHISRVLEASFECVRVGLIVAGIEVLHCHIHLVPIRDEGDLSFSNADASVPADKLDEAAMLIRSGLRAAGFAAQVPD